MDIKLRTAAVLALLLASAASQGALVRLHLGGSVDKVDAALAGTFHIADAISVDLAYDTAAAPMPGSTAARAGYDMAEMDLSFGSYHASYFASPGKLFATVLNNEHTVLGDADAFGGSAWQTGGGTPVAGLPLQQAFISLYDFTQTVFHDASLPSALNLADFQEAFAGLAFCTDRSCSANAQYSAVDGRLDSLSVQPATVPEPAGPTLVGLCCFAALVAARKHKS